MSSSPANAATAPSRLAERCPLSLDAALPDFDRLLNEVAAMHAAGRLHGNLAADAMELKSDGVVALPEALNEITPDANRPISDYYPPEFHGGPVIKLSTQIAAARAELQSDGLNCDPRRIDVYQLGVLWLRMISGQRVDTYLQSARSRSKVPALAREFIDRALGYAAESRFQTLDEMALGWMELKKSLSGVASLDTPAIGSVISGGSATPVHIASPAARITTLAEGSSLGPYRIERHIGGGGMGDVYRAYDETLDRFVAIKVLPPELARHEDFVRRFRAEAAAVAKLVHPNVVQIHTIGEDAGHYYFAMQYIEGQSLAGLIKSRGRLSTDETLSIVEQCLAGLKAAHDRGLIHRDVKPGNILLDRESNRALLADFGLVKGAGDASSLTATGVIMGTVDYIPPEQARGQTVDARADLYSLGVLMYQMLSGRLPFEAKSSTAVIFKHAYEQPPQLSEIAPDVPRRIVAIVTRLMAKNPAHRYQSAAEVAADIVAYRSGKPPAIPLRAMAEGSSIFQRGDELLKADGGGSSGALATEIRSRVAAIEAQNAADSFNWRDRFWSMFRRNMPQLAEQFAGTSQQVDDAIREYERRHQDLVQLVREAEELATELAAQAASHQEAAREAAKQAATAEPLVAARLKQEELEYQSTAVDFARQLKEHRAQTDDLQMRLNKTAGTLKQLQSQRDVLHMRLRAAHARIQMETSSVQHRRFPRWAFAVAAALGLIALCAIKMAQTNWSSTSAVIKSSTFTNTIAQTTDRSLLAYESFEPPTYMAGVLAGQNPHSKFFTGPWQSQWDTDKNGAFAVVHGIPLKYPNLITASRSVTAGDKFVNGSGGQLGNIATRTYRELASPLGDSTEGTYYISFLISFGKYGGTTGYRAWEMWNGSVDDPHRTLQIGYNLDYYPDHESNTDHNHLYLRLFEKSRFSVPIANSPEITTDDGAVHLFAIKFTMSKKHNGDSVSVYLDPTPGVEPEKSNASISGIDFFAQFLSTESQFIFPAGHSTLPDSQGAFGDLRIGTTFVSVTPPGRPPSDLANADAPTTHTGRQPVGPPTDALQVDGRSYKLFHKRGIPWDEAKQACEEMGGHLACPVSNDQLDTINKVKAGNAVWIGGYFDDKADISAWKWVTGQTIDRKSPSSDNPERYLTTATGSKTAVAARALDGMFRHPDGSVVTGGLNPKIQGYICEWDSAPLSSVTSPNVENAVTPSVPIESQNRQLTASASTLPQSIVGSFFAAGRGRFELFLSGKQLMFTGPQSEEINLHNGDVVMMRVKAETYGDDPGFKLEFVSSDGAFVWPCHRQDFRIVDVDAPEKANTSMVNRATVLPAAGHTSSDALEAWSKLTLPEADKSELMWWAGPNRWWQCAAVVEMSNFQRSSGAPRPLSALATSLPKPVDHSQTEAVEFDGHRYKAFPNLGISWQQAKLECEQMGGHLACPLTPEQLNFISNMQRGEGMWVGGFYDKSSIPNQWKWVTGQVIDRNAPENAGNMYLSTSDVNGSLVARLVDGTIRLPGGNTMLRNFTNIQGYVCEWDDKQTASQSISNDAK